MAFDPDGSIKADINAALEGLTKIHTSIQNELKSNPALVKVLNTHCGEVAVTVIERCMTELAAGGAYYTSLLQAEGK